MEHKKWNRRFSFLYDNNGSTNTNMNLNKTLIFPNVDFFDLLLACLLDIQFYYEQLILITCCSGRL